MRRRRSSPRGRTGIFGFKKAEAHNLDFTPDCPLNVLIAQIHHMGNYLHAMEVRAEYEGIDLGFCIKSLLHDLESAEGGCCVNAEDPTRY